MRSLVIIGAGGHGLVVAEAAQLMGQWDNIYFLDSKHPEATVINEFTVISEKVLELLPIEQVDIAVAIGDNPQRIALLQKYRDYGYNCPVIKHPAACISRSASIAYGTVILATAVINAKAIIGFGCIINTAAVIEHQCVLASGVHISPNVCLAGNVTIGSNSWIGAAAVVKNNKHIGHNVIVGAGSVVIDDISNNLCVVGVPARQKQLQEEKI